MNQPKPDALARAPQVPTWEVPLSIAPMMQRTDRHYRMLMRTISKRTLLWTEMITARALLHGPTARLLDYDAAEHPLVLQVGGDEPEEMAEAARLAHEWGYDEININVGCPSSRVQNGNFGACLMREPERVGRCVAAMAEAADIPVTVKHRIGVDEHDRYEDMIWFVDTVAQMGPCRRFTVHARKAWLEGLSPKENRNVPPLRPEEIWRLKRERPELVIELNGGITTLEQVERHLEHVDAVMIGRGAYDDPYMFAQADARIFGEPAPAPTRHEAARAMLPYIEAQLTEDEGCRLHHITRHMINLFHARPGARSWRRHLSEHHHRDEAGPEVVEAALELVPED